MGLDLVEIMLCIEDEFEIDIREDSVADIETVGALVDYVEQEIRKDEIPQWKASQVFADRLSDVKRELASVLKIPESEITSVSRLDKLIPRKRRREIWNSSPFLMKIGTLTLSCRQYAFTAIVAFLLGLPFLLYGKKIFADSDIGALLGWVAAIVVMFLSGIVIHLRLPETTISSKAKTVSDCARLLAAKEGVRLNRTGDLWTRDQIELRVREIISEQAGIKLDTIKLDQHLVKDLNLG